MNEIHDHKQELRSSKELLENLHESGRNDEGKVTRSHKETWAAPSTKETSADPVIFSPRASLFTKRTIPTNEEKLITIHAHSRYEEIWQLQSPNWPLRQSDQDERQRDGSRHWDSVKLVLMTAFAHKGDRDFDDGYWLRPHHEA